MTWDGKERRGPPFDEGHDDETLTPRQRRHLRRVYHWNMVIDQVFEKRYVISTIVFMQFLLLGIGFYGIVNTNHNAAQGVGETRKIVNFISQFVQSSSQAGAKRNNSIAEGLSCEMQVLITPAESRTQPQIDKCIGFFNQAIIPPPTKEQVDALLKQLGQK